MLKYIATWSSASEHTFISLISLPTPEYIGELNQTAKYLPSNESQSNSTKMPADHLNMLSTRLWTFHVFIYYGFQIEMYVLANISTL